MREPARAAATDPRGFTIIELMIVVAIIAILAAIVVPGWVRESRKGKASSEVNPMFTELSSKLQTNFTDTNTFEVGALVSGTPLVCPGAVPRVSSGTSPFNFTTSCVTSGSVWETLRIAAPSSDMRCQYTITVGKTGDTLSPPTGFLNSLGVAANEPAIAGGWWFVEAICDEDDQAGTNATFYMSSVNTKIQSQNEGS